MAFFVCEIGSRTKIVRQLVTGMPKKKSTMVIDVILHSTVSDLILPECSQEEIVIIEITEGFLSRWSLLFEQLIGKEKG